jgi:hypothetical protein
MSKRNRKADTFEDPRLQLLTAKALIERVLDEWKFPEHLRDELLIAASSARHVARWFHLEGLPEGEGLRPSQSGDPLSFLAEQLCDHVTVSAQPERQPARGASPRSSSSKKANKSKGARR